VSESKVDDRLARLFPERGASADPASPVFAAPPVTIEPASAEAFTAPPPAEPSREPLIYADVADGADLLNAGEATRPLAELALAADAATPFLIGFVGPSGSGASFALRRWLENVEALAAAAGLTAGSPFVSKVVVASIDGAAISGDPVCAIASAAFIALERDHDGVNYAALADEAANAGANPLRAAASGCEAFEHAAPVGSADQRIDQVLGVRHQAEDVEARVVDAGDGVDRAVGVGVAPDRAVGVAIAEGDSAAALRRSCNCPRRERWRP
jgi:hypothetical protein